MIVTLSVMFVSHSTFKKKNIFIWRQSVKNTVHLDLKPAADICVPNITSQDASRCSFCAHSCIVHSSFYLPSCRLWTARLSCPRSEASSVHFAVSKAKMEAESWRQCVWHGVASRLGATRVTVHTQPKQGDNDVTCAAVDFPEGGSGVREELWPSEPNNQSSHPPLWLLWCW